MHIKQHALLGHCLGTQRTPVSFHYGQPGHGEKVYLQASLHADELPGMLVLHHLKRLLAAAEARGEITGEIVVVPVANPIGLAQTLLHDQMGRFDFVSGENFNRHYPDFAALIGDRIETQLSDDPAANRRVIRAAMREALEGIALVSELDSLRHTLIELAHDADVVLDLHSDAEAVLHLYAETPYWPQIEPLACYLGAEATLLSLGSGGQSFDEACGQVWWRLAERFAGRYPIPLACVAATVELRAEADVYHPLAVRDATQSYAFLQHRRVIAGEPAPMPPLRLPPTAYEGSETYCRPVRVRWPICCSQLTRSRRAK